MRRELIVPTVLALMLAACASNPEVSADAANEGAARAAAPAAAAAPIQQQGVAAPAAAVAAAQPAQQGPAPGSREHFVVEVGDRVFFDFDRWDLTERAREIVARQAQYLRTYPSLRISVEGHCDERGTREYNLALGERRANAVLTYMVALGIDASRIEVVSYGKERPVALGANETAYALNRRAVTVIRSGPAG